MSFKKNLIELYERELQRLSEEVNAYEDEAALWLLGGQINNSAGNLCLHLIGNLNHFVGAVLGNSGYVRDRDSEFLLKNVPRQEILTRIDDTRLMVKSVLDQLPDHALEQIYPLKKHDETITTTQMLLHLLSHLNYHLGQVNYHRRLLGVAGSS